MKLSIASIFLVIALSAQGRNFGGISGSPIEPIPTKLTENETDVESQQTISSQEPQEGAATIKLSPWSEWMKLKTPPMALLKPKKKPFPAFTSSPSAPEELETPWVSWAKMKTAAIPIPGTGIFTSEKSSTSPQLQEVSWVALTSLKAPSYVLPPANTASISPLTYGQAQPEIANPMISPWAAWTKLKAATAASNKDIQSLSLTTKSEDSQEKYMPNQIPENLGQNPATIESITVGQNLITPLSGYFSTSPTQTPKSTSQDYLDGLVGYNGLPLNLMQPQQPMLFPPLSKVNLSLQPNAEPTYSPTQSLNMLAYSKMIEALKPNLSPSAISRFPAPGNPQIPLSPSNDFVYPMSKPFNPTFYMQSPINPSYSSVFLPRPTDSSFNPFISSIPEISTAQTSEEITPSLLNQRIQSIISSLESSKIVAPILTESKMVGLTPEMVEYLKSVGVKVPEMPSEDKASGLTPEMVEYLKSVGVKVPEMPSEDKASGLTPEMVEYLKSVGVKVPEIPLETAIPNQFLISTTNKMTYSNYPVAPPYQLPWLSNPSTQEKKANSTVPLKIAEEKLLVKWANNIFDMQKNSSWAPNSKSSILEAAFEDWLKLHNVTNVSTTNLTSTPTFIGREGTEVKASLLPTFPMSQITPLPSAPSPEEITTLIDWLKKIEAFPMEPKKIFELAKWLKEIEEPQTDLSKEPSPITSKYQLLVPEFIRMKPELLPTESNYPIYSMTSEVSKPPPPLSSTFFEAVRELLLTAPAKVKAQLVAWLTTNNISIPEPINPSVDVPPTYPTPVSWMSVSPISGLPQTSSIPIYSEALPKEIPLTLSKLEQLSPAQFSSLLQTIVENCKKTTSLVPRSDHSHHKSRKNNNQDSSEEQDNDQDSNNQNDGPLEMKRALYPISLPDPQPDPGMVPKLSKPDFVPQEFWEMIPTVAPNTTIVDPGFWAAKKSMFISKLFDALARVTLNYTNSATTESPKQQLLRKMDTVLLSDAARSVKDSDEDSAETSTDDEDLINSEEPKDLPKEPENPLHKLFKFGVQKTILSDLSTTPTSNQPFLAASPPITTTTPVSTTTINSLVKQKSLLDKLKSLYETSRKNYQKAKKAKSKAKKKFRGSTTTSGPIDFEELAKALLVQPNK